MIFRRRGDAIDHAQCEADRLGREMYVHLIRDQWAVSSRRSRPCLVVQPMCAAWSLDPSEVRDK